MASQLIQVSDMWSSPLSASYNRWTRETEFTESKKFSEANPSKTWETNPVTGIFHGDLVPKRWTW